MTRFLTSLQDLRKPSTFDDEFAHILKSQLETPTITRIPERQSRPITLPTSRHFQHGRTLVFSNLIGPSRPSYIHTDPSHSSIKIQLTNIFLRLTKLLESYHTTANQITHCTLLLRDMKDFSSINALYAKFFAFTNPPSRVTVAVGDTLPAGKDVMLTVIAHLSTAPGQRTGLHVQSQSYWAPANIGPYSQAISVPLTGEQGREVHIAGQIPLEPSSMALYTKDGFTGEAVLALQHLFRIARTQGVKWWTAGVAMIPSSTETDAQAQGERVGITQAVWKAAHTAGFGAEDEDEEVVDAWDRKNFSKAFDDTSARAPVPDYDIFDREEQAELRAPPCVVVEVDALPRYASVEWACLGLDVSSLQQSYSTDPSQGVKEFAVRHPERSFEYRVVEIPDGDVDVEQVLSHMEHGTLYASVKGTWSDERWAKNGVSWVPCKRVWGEGGKEIRGVIVGGR